MEIGLSLGSNLGDRLGNLVQARRRILMIPGIAVSAVSPLYETEPVDVLPEHEQLSFLNAVMIVESSIDPALLLADLRSLEAAIGRKTGGAKNLPRPVDVDIIYAGELVMRGKDLTIPHPRWAERRFVVQPLCDTRPALKIPGEKRAVSDVLLALPPAPKVVLYAAKW